LYKYSPICYINPKEECQQVFIMDVSVAPKVSLVLSELFVSIESESGECGRTMEKRSEHNFKVKRKVNNVK
jgi:hypothetical protein